MPRHRLAHIINPVAAGPGSDLYIAQPVTFASMHIASRFSPSLYEVQLLTAQYPEDHAIIPEFFTRTSDMTRSVLDYGTFSRPRKLPLIRDILDRLSTASDADYLIYTNVDIALMPGFYAAVCKLIESGLDAFVINRRTISKQYRSPAELPLMYAEIGASHLGFDCFVFKREQYAHYDLGNTCIGAGGIGMMLTANLICFSQRFLEVGNAHLTFHIGNDESWRNEALADYSDYNLREVRGVFQRLAPRFVPANLPEIGQPELKHYLQTVRQQLDRGSR
jgi:hypothetical protein